MKWSIYGTTGELLELSNCVRGVQMGTSPRGLLGMPGVSFDGARTNNRRAGSTRGTARKLARDVFVPFVFDVASEDELYAIIEFVTRELDPEWGDCRIVGERDDGTKRDMVATYDAGFQPVVAWKTATRAKVLTRFTCNDPYWHSTTLVSNELVFPVSGSGASLTRWDDPDVLWDEPGMPFDGFQATDVSSSARTDVVLSCTAPVWPRWEIIGPGTRVELHNVAAASTFIWEGALGDGARMTIDFDESRRHVRINGVNAWSGLADDSEFWQLKPGNGPDAPQFNPVFAQVVGSDSTTECSMIYRPAFLSP